MTTSLSRTNGTPTQSPATRERRRSALWAIPAALVLAGLGFAPAGTSLAGAPEGGADGSATEGGPSTDSHSNGCPNYPNYWFPGGWPKAEVVYAGNSIGYSDNPSGGVTYTLYTAGGAVGLWIVDNPCTQTLKTCGSTSLTNPILSCFVSSSYGSRQVVVGYHSGFGGVAFALTKS